MVNSDGHLMDIDGYYNWWLTTMTIVMLNGGRWSEAENRWVTTWQKKYEQTAVVNGETARA